MTNPSKVLGSSGGSSLFGMPYLFEIKKIESEEGIKNISQNQKIRLSIWYKIITCFGLIKRASISTGLEEVFMILVYCI